MDKLRIGLPQPWSDTAIEHISLTDSVKKVYDDMVALANSYDPIIFTKRDALHTDYITYHQPLDYAIKAGEQMIKRLKERPASDNNRFQWFNEIDPQGFARDFFERHVHPKVVPTPLDETIQMVVDRDKLW